MELGYREEARSVKSLLGCPKTRVSARKSWGQTPFSGKAAAVQVVLTKVEMRDGGTRVGFPAGEGPCGWIHVGLTAVELGNGWTEVLVTAGNSGMGGPMCSA